MKCLSVRVIAPSVLLVSTVLSPVLAWSMEEMTDSQLSITTGQDGITVLISPPPITTTGLYPDATGYVTDDGRTIAALAQTNGLKIGAVVLHDKDGIADNGTMTGYTNGGAFIFGDASQANSNNPVGVQMGLYGSTPIAVKIDASNGKTLTGLGGTLPVLNINVALPADLLIRTGDVSVSASNRNSVANPIPVGVSGATIENAAIGGTQGNAYKIMNSMDITFGNTPAGQAISFNVQLGKTPQGGMISFGTLNISQINFSSLSLASPNGGVSPSQLAMTPLITNLDLTGATIDAVNDMGLALGGSSTGIGGVIFSDASLTVGSIQLNGVIAGSVGAISANIASNMANASMGSFGVTGLTATNLRIGVSGM